MEAKLILEDGTEFIGTAIGNSQCCEGEVVFTTGMTGYQETISDPSYCKQIVVFTYPLVGNYGINLEDMEAIRPYLYGVVTSEICSEPSNYQCRVSLGQYLSDNNIAGISDIDTRKLTKILRQKGTMKGKIVTESGKFIDKYQGLDVVEAVTTKETYIIPGGNKRVVLVDLGAKQGIIRQLAKRDITVVVVHAQTSAQEIISYQPHGVLLSNGPGDPKDIKEISDNIKNLVGIVPLFGICLGHQMLGLALGMDSYKMKFGHRGGNHPVKDLTSGRVFITSQNHGYALKNYDVPDDIEITHLNLNDNTVEGFRHKVHPVLSTQYHPEASPGPRDSSELFDNFLSVIENWQKGKVS